MKVSWVWKYVFPSSLWFLAHGLRAQGRGRPFRGIVRTVPVFDNLQAAQGLFAAKSVPLSRWRQATLRRTMRAWQLA
jgi:hypothetical protein